jgi:hypothetical protein
MNTTQLPYWIQVIQALGPSFVAIVAALIAGLIAYRQWQTTQDKLRLDLFEKRYAYFIALRELMIDVIQHGQPESEKLNDFTRKIVGAEFVFNAELSEYIQSVRARAQQLKAISRMLENLPVGDRRNTLVDNEARIFESLNDEFEHLEEKFRVPMNFAKK